MSRSLTRTSLATGLGWALIAVLATLPARAQMSMGSQDTMEGMGGMSDGMEAAPALKKAPAKAAPAPAKAKSVDPEATTPPATKPMDTAPASRSGPAPASAPQPAMEGMGTSTPGMEMSAPSSGGHADEPGHEEAGMEGMSEPPPSSMDGGRILIVFAVLNAAIVAVAAVLKFRRNPTTTSREVKA